MQYDIENYKRRPRTVAFYGRVSTEHEQQLSALSNQMDWYIKLRRYGGCTHSGFGMGFERLIIYLTGVENIRDVIPYPRTPNNCEF